MSNTQNDKLDFSAVLAASVHDMKNSLSLLIQSIETLSLHIPLENKLAHDHISSTHYEALRLNTNLVQMLSLYRAGKSNLPVTIEECNVNDVFDDIAASNRYYCQQRGIELVYDCDAHLDWFFDSELVYLLLNDAVVNALRYGKSRVSMTASIKSSSTHEEKLCIQIEDDGDGYPDSMLVDNNTVISASNIKEGRTGLGIFFAKMIVNAHDNNGSRGEISLKNGGRLGGSVFTVNLP